MNKDVQTRPAIAERVNLAYAITATLFAVIGVALFTRDLSEASIRWGMRRSERALVYAMPNHSNPGKP